MQGNPYSECAYALIKKQKGKVSSEKESRAVGYMHYQAIQGSLPWPWIDP